MRTRLLFVLCSATLLAASVLGAVQQKKIIAPSKLVEDEIGAFARQTRVGPERRHGALTLFAVSVSGVRTPAVDLTLDKAAALNLIEILELKTAEVNRLRLRNKAKKPVFAMAGEMLRGGRQDRIVQDDLILPGGAELVVPVFCVEHGRWAGERTGFSAGHSLAGAAVRGGGARGGQSAVWSEVADTQKRLRAPSATGALRSVHDSAEIRDRMGPYLKALTDLPDRYPKASGVVAAVNGEILAADLFTSAALFRQVWPELLESYIIDTLDREAQVAGHRHGEDRGPGLNATDVQLWLNGVPGADRGQKDTPGNGVLYALRGPSLTGSALVWDRGVVHAELFPARSVKHTEFNSLRFRRERLQDE